MCNYYHIYIRKYAHLAGPLQELLKVGSRVKVNWQQVHQQSFDDIKKAVLNIRALNLINQMPLFTLGVMPVTGRWVVLYGSMTPRPGESPRGLLVQKNCAMTEKMILS